jgi:plasmid stability protein
MLQEVFMLSLTLKNISPLIHRKLKQNARAHHRSMNGEALACLEAALLAYPSNRQTLLAKIRHSRENVEKQVYLTDKKLSKIIKSGRP